MAGPLKKAFQSGVYGNGATTRLRPGPPGPPGPTDYNLLTNKPDLTVYAPKPQASKNPLTGWYHADGFGAKGDGATDDTAAIQAALDAAGPGGTVYVPDGIYLVTGNPTITGDDITVHFSGDAWIQPTTGVGITVSGNQRCTLISPRIRFSGGTPTAGITVSNATRTTITDPVVWIFGNVTSTVDGIVVDNNSYWCSIERPRFRKASSTLTSDFRRCVSFTNTANAGRVIGGDFAFATTGVYVDSTNATLVDGGAFEFVTDGVELGGAGSVAGTRVVNTRHEEGTNCVNITCTNTTLDSPLYFGAFTRVSSVGNLIANPNNLPYTSINGSQWTLAADGYGTSDKSSARITLQPYVSQIDPCLQVVRSGVKNWMLTHVGDMVFKSASATPPANPDYNGDGTKDITGWVRHYNQKTTVASVNPANANGYVSLAVGVAGGTGDGTVQDVLVASAFNTSPGADDRQSLGTTSARWKDGYFSGVVKVGAKDTASRPAAATVGAGAHMFDTALNKPIWSNGTNWVDANGVTV